MISAIGHVALRVPNLDDSVRWATTVMGLREVARESNTSYLTHGGQHHSLSAAAQTRRRRFFGNGIARV